MKTKRFTWTTLLFMLFIGATCCILMAKSVQRHDDPVQQISTPPPNMNAQVQQSVSNTVITAPRGNPLYEDKTDLSRLAVSELVSYKNLQVCLLYGQAELDGKKYVTLAEALKNKLVVVHETSSVNELSLDNNSSEYIYINSGDIVKGGKQDRTIQYDVIIPPKKKNVDLASFCVEHGRWEKRGNESTAGFATSENSLSSKDLKISAKYKKSQSEVWDKVEEYQSKANYSINKDKAPEQAIDVKSDVSASSLELTLRDEEIVKLNADYKKYFESKITNKTNAVGFAYFINGKLYGIDVYNNHRLFNDLYGKLLDAMIAEAISEDNGKPVKDKADPNIVKALLKADAKVYHEEQVNGITQFNTSEHNTLNNIVIFTTIDKDENNWLHRNWLDKSEE